MDCYQTSFDTAEQTEAAKKTILATGAFRKNLKNKTAFNHTRIGLVIQPYKNKFLLYQNTDIEPPEFLQKLIKDVHFEKIATDIDENIFHFIGKPFPGINVFMFFYRSEKFPTDLNKVYFSEDQKAQFVGSNYLLFFHVEKADDVDIPGNIYDQITHAPFTEGIRMMLNKPKEFREASGRVDPYIGQILFSKEISEENAAVTIYNQLLNTSGEIGSTSSLIRYANFLKHNYVYDD